MRVPPPIPGVRRPLRVLCALTAAAALTACGATTGAAPGAATPAEASEAEWRALATERPVPLDGAARVSIGGIALGEGAPWELAHSVDLELGIAELVAAGLLRRRDVHFVERRRFAAAFEAERRGQARPAGAPRAGVSVSPELILSATWARFGSAASYLELRLADAESGSVVGARRIELPSTADPVGLSRAIVGGLLAELADLGRRPAWTDPDASASAGYAASGVGEAAVEAFLRGLAAEERWSWEAARRGYQEATLAAPGFVEASAALARTARLRMGGTLGVGP